MAEITYRSPGFFESEIDLSISAPGEVTATPAGVIGPSPMGPAFIPVTVSSLAQFKDRFFGTSTEYNDSYYSAQEFFRNGQALTFLRTLGAGANSTTTDIVKTQTQGTAKGAGFVIKGTSTPDLRAKGAVQFIVANHDLKGNVDAAYPVFADNNSFSSIYSVGGVGNIVRGMLMFPTGTRGMLLSYDENYTEANVANDAASVETDSTLSTYKTFKLVISSSANSFGVADGFNGIKIFTASLDPANPNYISRVLNTSPELFQEKQHLLYMDFAVEDELASISTSANSVALVSGSSNTSTTSGDPTQSYLNAFGRFDARYSPAKTTKFISQPFAGKEYDLFHFETIADGEISNDQFKISIANLKRSSDPLNLYGTFDVLVRSFYDSDSSPSVLEQYVNCTLNPSSRDYVATKIGDRKAYYNFDTIDPLDKNFVVEGQRENKSSRIRIVMTADVENGSAPSTSLPFGFRGVPTIKFSNGLTDTSLPALSNRMFGILPTAALQLTASISPPVPLRYKVTNGATDSSFSFIGAAGSTEFVDGRIYWGVKFDSFPSVNGSLGASAILQSNAATALNPLIPALARFAGIEKLDVITSGSAQDAINNNKFSLANVALSNAKDGRTALAAAVADLTGTLDQHMSTAVYIRNAVPNVIDSTITDTSITNRLTLGTLAQISSPSIFNRFSQFMKFTNMFYGGFDGLNILDKDMAAMNDKATSSETGGKAISSPDIGLNIAANNFAAGSSNAIVGAYNTAIDIMTDPGVSRANILTVPGIREPAFTDYAARASKYSSRMIYLMDIPAYTGTGVRIFSPTVMPDVNSTISNFVGRNINNSYVATYFPDVSIVDDSTTTSKRVRVPSSVIALGALAQNDAKAFPWYAPAGFNRTSLSSVVNLAVRLSSVDRDNLYDSRINPITAFPGLGHVIFGQKTLQLARTALDRVNVRRLLIELARIVTAVGLQFVFEQNTPATRSRFVGLLTPAFATVQSQSGIDSFRIIMNESNNTQRDIEANKLNGRIIIVPTKAVEYIAIDFIITNEGVEFV